MTKVTGLSDLLMVTLSPEETFRMTQKADPLEWQVPYLWETRNAVILKGRQVGASTSGAVLCIRYCKTHPNALAAIVSPSLKQSTEVKNRAKASLEAIREPLILDNATTLGFRNGSRIMSLPGSAKSVRGWTADILVIDEAAFLDPATFLAARATVATGGRIIVQSTPAGPYGPFYDLYSEATDASLAVLEDGSTPDPTIEWVRFHISSEDVPTIRPDFLAAERASMSDEEYAQEYLGQFAAAGIGLVDPKQIAEVTAGDDDPWRAL